jgi:hypothetical protein
LIVTYIHSNNIFDQNRVQFRCQNFSDALRRTGWNSSYLLDLESFIQNTEKAQEICKKSDLLIIHRHLYGAVLQSVQYWKAQGKKILVDIDEAPNLLTPDIEDYQFWRMGILKPGRKINGMFPNVPVLPIPLEQFSRGLKLIDAAIAPSARLADDWNNIVKTFHIPDYLNTDQYLMVRRQQKQKIHIGVSGCHISSLDLQRSGLLTALEHICTKRADIVVYFFDVDGALIIHSSCIPLQQRVIVDNTQSYSWPGILSNLDIGITPVEGALGARTSVVRALEYNVTKVPWLASDLPPYRELNRYGWLVPNTTEQWEASITEVINHLDAYQVEAEREPYLFALSQDIYENIGKVLTTYESILNR